MKMIVIVEYAAQEGGVCNGEEFHGVHCCGYEFDNN